MNAYVTDSYGRPEQPVFEELALCQLPQCVLNSECKRNNAIALYCLHKMELKDRANEENGGSIVGSVTSEKEGELAMSYSGANNSGSSSALVSELSSTTWGVQLLAIIKSCVMTVTTGRMC